MASSQVARCLILILPVESKVESLQDLVVNLVAIIPSTSPSTSSNKTLMKLN